MVSSGMELRILLGEQRFRRRLSAPLKNAEDSV